jgi:hypothetical protein
MFFYSKRKNKFAAYKEKQSKTGAKRKWKTGVESSLHQFQTEMQKHFFESLTLMLKCVCSINTASNITTSMLFQPT